MQIPRVNIEKILYTTDLSESGRHAFPFAASFANLYKADLTVLHVIEAGPELDRQLTGYINDELWEEIKQRNLKEAQELLHTRKRDDASIRETLCQYFDTIQANNPETPYVTYGIQVEFGDAVQNILRVSEEGNFNLIVMGRHGHGFIHEAVLGGITRVILRKCKVPVVVVPAPTS